MRSKLFAGSALAAVLTVAAVTLAGGFTKSPATVRPEPSQAVDCLDGSACCPECIACCAEDGCCWECVECCIEMGCEPSFCFEALTSAKAEAPDKAEVSCAQPAENGEACCADGGCK